MQVTKIISPAETKAPAAHRLTDKQLYDEINYHRAEKLTKKMLEKGLITCTSTSDQSQPPAIEKPRVSTQGFSIA